MAGTIILSTEPSLPRHRGRKPNSPEDFWSRVSRAGPDECWLWVGADNGHGYGQFWWRGKPMRAHKLAYELENNITLPRVRNSKTSICVCHSCDTPLCCNPRHLWLGTLLDNKTDEMAKGRNARGDRQGLRLHPESRLMGDGHWSRIKPELLARGDDNGSRVHPESLSRGEENWQAKLTAYDIPIIRARRMAGHTLRRIGDAYGVNSGTIHCICTRETWAHIP